MNERGSSINVRGISRWPRCARGALCFTPTGYFHEPAERNDPPTVGRVAGWRTTVWCPSQPPRGRLLVKGESRTRPVRSSSLVGPDLLRDCESLVEIPLDEATQCPIFVSSKTKCVSRGIQFLDRTRIAFDHQGPADLAAAPSEILAIN